MANWYELTGSFFLCLFVKTMYNVHKAQFEHPPIHQLWVMVGGFQKLQQESGSRFVSINKGPADIYLLKGNNRNTIARCEICSKLTYC